VKDSDQGNSAEATVSRATSQNEASAHEKVVSTTQVQQFRAAEKEANGTKLMENICSEK